MPVQDRFESAYLQKLDPLSALFSRILREESDGKGRGLVTLPALGFGVEWGPIDAVEESGGVAWVSGIESVHFAGIKVTDRQRCLIVVRVGKSGIQLRSLLARFDSKFNGHALFGIRSITLTTLHPSF